MEVECDVACVFTTFYNEDYWEKLGHSPLLTYSERPTFTKYISKMIKSQKMLLEHDSLGKLVIIYDLDGDNPEINIPDGLDITVIDHDITPVKSIEMSDETRKFVNSLKPW